MENSIKDEKTTSKVKGELLKVLMVVMVLFIGGVGLRMGILINQTYGPDRTVDKRLIVREMLLESILDKEREQGEI